MKVVATQDVRTERITKLTLEPRDFIDERTLVHLHNALSTGRKIYVEINDDSEYAFRLNVEEITEV